jgi:hypothetical protein
MRLSDVRRRKPKLIYLNHSTPPDFTEAATPSLQPIVRGLHSATARLSLRLVSHSVVPPRPLRKKMAITTARRPDTEPQVAQRRQFADPNRLPTAGRTPGFWEARGPAH